MATKTVNYARVHAMQAACGKRLPEIETRRQQLLRAQRPPTGHSCVSWQRPAGRECGEPAVAKYATGWLCAAHVPNVERCVAPLRCYCRKHLGNPDKIVTNDDARVEMQHIAQERTFELKREISRLASGRTPFGLAELVEFLPRARSSARAAAEQWVRSTLAEGVTRGVVVQHGDRQWKGTR